MLKLPPADYVEFLRRTGMDAAYLYEGWFLGRKNKTDERGRVHYVDGTIKSRANFDQVKPPSLDPVRKRIESYLEAAAGTGLGTVYALDIAPTIAVTAIGPTDYLDDRDFVRELMDRIEEYTLPQVECVLEYPVDALFVTGPQCWKAGPMLSPSLHRELIFPRVEKVVRMANPKGVPVILHTDGDNTVFMDWIIKTGFAGLHPIEPMEGSYTIYNLKQSCGDKLCLFGNIDVAGVLSSGMPEEVRADALDHLRRLAPGGGYVCGSSHDIGENVPFANFVALAETVCSYRHLRPVVSSGMARA
jgi:uroporphyrinogen decarboxylase